MDCGIEVDAPLDYATIQICPSQNRYEVFVSADDEVEKLASGLLEQLVPQLPGVEKLHREGSNANFKLQVAERSDKTWFTKSTLNRFLKIIASPDFISSNKLIEAEVSQLEEARKFHLSLYAKEREGLSENGETDIYSSKGTALTCKSEVKAASSDSSKDELLKAIDLRLTALSKEQAAALDQAAGFTCSSKDVRNLVDFCDYFGVAAELRVSLRKFMQLNHMNQTSVVEKRPSMCTSRNDNMNEKTKDTQTSTSTHSETPVKYGVSPAVVAQVERQSSTESDESSDSSDENQVSAERSRGLTRAVQPRRSASPMRRVQIGRSGSRRAPAVMIKSLGHYPGREKTLNFGDAAENCSEDEGSEQTSKRPQNDVRRMSVQDAISLFERKQRDQSPDAQKRLSSNPALCTNKSVLRRWTAGTTKSTATCELEVVSGDSGSLACETVVTGGCSNSSAEEKLQSRFTEAGQMSSKTDASLEELEVKEPDPVDTKDVTNATKEQKTNGISTPSAEWSRQKEEELNQMLTKMMDSKLTKSRKPQTIKNQNAPSDHRGGFYDHYKEKRDEKLRGENARKKAEKDARFKAIQQTLDEQKAAMSSRSAKTVGKNQPSPRQQKPLKSASQPAEPRSETSKASGERKFSSRASTLSSTRKSWPSTPSARGISSSPSNIPARTSPAVTTPTQRKPLSTPSVPRSAAKVERTQPHQRNVDKAETSRKPKVMKENSQKTVTKSEKRTATKSEKRTVTKSEKRTVIKAAAAPRDSSGTVVSKPSLYNKMTKKGSVVPVVSKLSIRKGSELALSKSNRSSQLEETSTNCKNTPEIVDHEVVVSTSIPEIDQEEPEVTSTVDANASVEPETVINSSQHSCVFENTNEDVNDCVDNGSLNDTVLYSTKSQPQEEESMISPSAWEEMDDSQKMQNSYDDGSSQLTSPINGTQIGLSSPRVRHSLSQMLQEESSEADAVEWGNAENPPAIAYQKDAPKGLKRLLKFARKSKGDTNSIGWSSPSVFSEGEDDSEESKAISRRNSDNLAKKVQLHLKNSIDSHEFLSAQSNLSKFEVQNSRKLSKGDISTTASSAKASRSFFSLSAFRGGKPN